MKPPYSNSSLLALLTGAIAACGDSSSVLPSADGGQDETSLAFDTGAGESLSGDDGEQDQGAGDTNQGQGTRDGATGDATGGTSAKDATAERVGDASPGDGTAAAEAEAGCPPPFMVMPDGTCRPPTVRRPFLVGASMRSAQHVSRRDWSRPLDRSLSVPDAATAEALAQSWLKDALEEHASVAAFARFTMLLLSAGAPPDLVAQSQRASIDEIHHARACFALAERYGGRAYGPSCLSLQDALAPSSLADIAALTAQEGCVGETLGAMLAGEQLRLATDPEVQVILRKIAADEVRHAELAWRFARWAAATGGEGVRRAIVRAAEGAIQGTLAMEVRSPAGVDVETWHAHGRLTCAEARTLASRTIRQVVRPCLALLEGGVTSQRTSVYEDRPNAARG